MWCIWNQKLMAPEVIPAAGMSISFSLIVSRLWGESCSSQDLLCPLPSNCGSGIGGMYMTSIPNKRRV